MVMDTKAQRRNGGTIDQAHIEAFKADFKGQIVVPGDQAYDDARRIWNANIDKRPAIIARCTGTADVVQAVHFARAHDLIVAVRGGGHNVAGRAVCDDGIVIDLSPMRGVYVNPADRTVRAQGGALIGDVDRETQLHGLAVPFGTVSKTGVGGLTLGGGVGWLVRKYGMSCDNVLSCEVVTAKGEVITADEKSNPDLFWGLRGGGGNFGIVTSFLYRAHPVATVLGGLILYPRDQARDVLRNYRAFMTSAPDELTAYAALVTAPDGTPAVGIVPCYTGDMAEGERLLKRLREFGSPMLDAVQPMPFLTIQQLVDSMSLDNAHNYWKPTFVTELKDELIDALIEQSNRAESPYSVIVIELYGGAAGQIAPSATAFAQRQAEYNIQIAAQWTDAAESDKHIAWTRSAAAAVAPFSSGGYLLNFIGDEKPDVVKAAFGGNFKRLTELKKKYDPANFFRLNQNVPPAP
jgi:FAD/FMN-containing dehydrogenase